MLTVHVSTASPRQLPASLHPLHVDMTLMRSAGHGVSGMAHNPSVTVHDGRLLAVVRVLFLSQRTTHNITGHIDDGWRFGNQRLSVDLTGGPRNHNAMTRGYEDWRLISWKSRLFASATTCDRVPGDPRPKIAVLDLDNNCNVVRARVQPSGRHEKNWMPVVDGEDLRFVYSAEPRIILDFSEATGLVVPSACDVDLQSSIIRGGSQLVPYEDGYLAVVHEVHHERAQPHGNGRYVYYHRLARFDRGLHVLRMSEPFYFRGLGIEFCAGLAEWKEHFVLSFGIEDREAYLAVVHRDVVQRMVRP